MRRLLVGASVVLFAALAVGLALVGVPLISVATAYKAKTLCSEVFVAGRPVADVMKDLEIDDLVGLRAVRATVSEQEGIASARFLLFTQRQAHFDATRGCTLRTRRSRPATVARAVTRRADSEHTVPTLDTVVALPPASRRAIEAALDSAFSDRGAELPRRTRAIVVMHHGRVVAERYADGVGPETPLPGWSMTKSVLNALVGVAVGQGKLELNAPVPLRAWRAPDDPRRRITVSDLLRMSSGLEFDEGQTNPSSDLLRMLYDVPDMAAFAADKELNGRPGARWKYSTGTTVILSRVLREALGDDAYRDLPQRALFGPLGMTHAVLEVDESGTFVASSYMYATAREWGRLGQLYLQDGVWNGTRILPEGWVEYTRTPAPAAPDSLYGAHFWLRTPGEYRGPAVPLPAGVFQAIGHEGQFLTIVPTHDVVIVRLGRTRFPRAWAHDRFIASVLAALQP